MNLYSVLLVDDEEDVIRVIMKKMDWEALGFRVAGYAHNGVEALELAEEVQPDVVMTDIKMPYMDGLTLSHKLKEIYKTIRIIIFSGFDEFEYAKEAIHAEVEEYLLKPVNMEELSAVFRRIRKSLDEEKKEKYNIEKLRAYYEESLPLLQENFYTSLMEGKIPVAEIPKYLENYQIRLNGPYYLASLLHISAMTYSDGMDSLLMGISVKKLAEEQIMKNWRCRILQYLGDILVIAQFESEEAVTEYTDALDDFCRLANRVYGARVTAGIGQVCKKVQDLRTSYEGARNAISYRTLYGNTRAINIAEVEGRGNTIEVEAEQRISQILKKTRVGDVETLNEEIAEFVRELSESGMNLEQYRTCLMVLHTEISKFGSNNNLNLEPLFARYGDIYNHALQADSPEELKNWLTIFCEAMQELLSKERQDSTRSLVTRAVAYVETNFADQEISIKTICRELGVSAAYFSTIFKKETGKTFIGYLTDYRLEKAVELLTMTEDKTYIIAQKTGYSDANYFSYVFKKQFGLSPSKYRVNHKRNPS